MDFNAITKTYISRIRLALGRKVDYGKRFGEDDPFGFGYESQYEFMFFNRPFGIGDFTNFLKNKKDIKSILEVGCSVGLYPRTFPDLFRNLEYTGIDISQRSIDICKQHVDSEFICDDFLKMSLDKKYDMIISFHVIDHVENIDLFISKIIDSCKKYAYITSYRGYFPELAKHKTEYRPDQGIFYNDISIKQVEKILLQKNISRDKFRIRSLIERDKVIYDSDLGRVWKYSNQQQKDEIMKLSSLPENILNSLPTKLETDTKIVDSCLGLDVLIAKKIGFDVTLEDMHPVTIIEVDLTN